MSASALDTSVDTSQAKDPQKLDQLRLSVAQERGQQEVKQQEEVTQHKHHDVVAKHIVEVKYEQRERLENSVTFGSLNPNNAIASPIASQAAAKMTEALVEGKTVGAEPNNHASIWMLESGKGKKKGALGDKSWIAQKFVHYKTILPDETIEKLGELIERGGKVGTETFAALTKDIATQLKGHDHLLSLFVSQREFRDGLKDYLSEQIEKKLKEKNVQNPEQKAKEFKVEFEEALKDVLKALNDNLKEIREAAPVLAAERGWLLALEHEKNRDLKIKELDKRIGEVREDASVYQKLGVDKLTDIELRRYEAEARFITISEEAWKIARAEHAPGAESKAVESRLQAYLKSQESFLSEHQDIRKLLDAHIEKARSAESAAEREGIVDPALEHHFTNLQAHQPQLEEHRLVGDAPERKNAIALQLALEKGDKLFETLSDVDALSQQQWKEVTDQFKRLERADFPTLASARISSKLEMLSQSYTEAKKSNSPEALNSWRKELKQFSSSIEAFLVYQPELGAELRKAVELVANRDTDLQREVGKSVAIASEVEQRNQQDRARFEQASLKLWELGRKVEIKSARPGSEKAVSALADLKNSIEDLLVRNPELRTIFAEHELKARSDGREVVNKAREAALALHREFSNMTYSEDEGLTIRQSAIDLLKGNVEHKLLVRQLYEEMSHGKLLREEFETLSSSQQGSALATYNEPGSSTPASQSIAAAQLDKYFNSQTHELVQSKQALSSTETRVDGPRLSSQVVAELRTALDSPNRIFAVAQAMRGIEASQAPEILTAYRDAHARNFADDYAKRIDPKSAADKVEFDLLQKLMLGQSAEKVQLEALVVLRAQEYGTKRAEALCAERVNTVHLEQLKQEFEQFETALKASDNYEEVLKTLPQHIQYAALVKAGELYVAEVKKERIDANFHADRVLDESAYQSVKVNPAVKRIASTLQALGMNEQGFETLKESAHRQADPESKFVAGVYERLVASTGALGTREEEFLGALEVALDAEHGKENLAQVRRLLQMNKSKSLEQYVEDHLGEKYRDRAYARLKGNLEETRASDASYWMEKGGLFGTGESRDPQALKQLLIELNRKPEEFERFEKAFNAKYASRFQGMEGELVSSSKRATSFVEALNAAELGENKWTIVAYGERQIVRAHALELNDILWTGFDQEKVDNPDAEHLVHFMQQVTDKDGKIDTKMLRAVMADYNKLHQADGSTLLPDLAGIEGPQGDWVRSTFLGREIEAKAHQTRYAITKGITGADSDMLKNIFGMPQDLQIAATRLERNPDQFTAEQQAAIRKRVEENGQQRAQILASYSKLYPGGDAVKEACARLNTDKARAVTMAMTGGKLEIEDILYHAMKKDRWLLAEWGTDKETIRHVFMDLHLTKAEIEKVSANYNRVYKRDLRSDLKSELGLDYGITFNGKETSAPVLMITGQYYGAYRKLMYGTTYGGGKVGHDVLYMFDHGTPQNVAEKIDWIAEKYRFEKTSLAIKSTLISVDFAGDQIKKIQKAKPYIETVQKFHPDHIVERLQGFGEKLKKGEKLNASEEQQAQIMLLGMDLALDVCSDLKTAVGNQASQGAAMVAAGVSMVATAGADAPAAMAIIASASAASRIATKEVFMGQAYSSHDLVLDVGYGAIDGVSAVAGMKVTEAVAGAIIREIGTAELQLGKVYVGPGNVAVEGENAVAIVGRAKAMSSYVGRASVYVPSSALGTAVNGAVMSTGYTLLDENLYDRDIVDIISQVTKNGIHGGTQGLWMGAAGGLVVAAYTPFSVRMAEKLDAKQTEELLANGKLTEGRYVGVKKSGTWLGKGTQLQNAEIELLEEAIRKSPDGAIRRGDIELLRPLTPKEVKTLFKDKALDVPCKLEPTKTIREVLTETYNSRGGYLTRQDMLAFTGQSNPYSYVIERIPLQAVEEQLVARQARLTTLNTMADAPAPAYINNKDVDAIFKEIERTKLDVDRLTKVIENRRATEFPPALPSEHATPPPLPGNSRLTTPSNNRLEGISSTEPTISREFNRGGGNEAGAEAGVSTRGPDSNGGGQITRVEPLKAPGQEFGENLHFKLDGAKPSSEVEINLLGEKAQAVASKPRFGGENGGSSVEPTPNRNGPTSPPNATPRSGRILNGGSEPVSGGTPVNEGPISRADLEKSLGLNKKAANTAPEVQLEAKPRWKNDGGSAAVETSPAPRGPKPSNPSADSSTPGSSSPAAAPKNSVTFKEGPMSDAELSEALKGRNKTAPVTEVNNGKVFREGPINKNEFSKPNGSATPKNSAQATAVEVQEQSAPRTQGDATPSPRRGADASENPHSRSNDNSLKVSKQKAPGEEWGENLHYKGSDEGPGVAAEKPLFEIKEKSTSEAAPQKTATEPKAKKAPKAPENHSENVFQERLNQAEKEYGPDSNVGKLLKESQKNEWWQKGDDFSSSLNENNVAGQEWWQKGEDFTWTPDGDGLGGVASGPSGNGGPKGGGGSGAAKFKSGGSSSSSSPNFKSSGGSKMPSAEPQGPQAMLKNEVGGGVAVMEPPVELQMGEVDFMADPLKLNLPSEGSVLEGGSPNRILGKGRSAGLRNGGVIETQPSRRFSPETPGKTGTANPAPRRFDAPTPTEMPAPAPETQPKRAPVVKPVQPEVPQPQKSPEVVPQRVAPQQPPVSPTEVPANPRVVPQRTEPQPSRPQVRPQPIPGPRTIPAPHPGTQPTVSPGANAVAQLGFALGSTSSSSPGMGTGYSLSTEPAVVPQTQQQPIFPTPPITNPDDEPFGRHKGDSGARGGPASADQDDPMVRKKIEEILVEESEHRSEEFKRRGGRAKKTNSHGADLQTQITEDEAKRIGTIFDDEIGEA